MTKPLKILLFHIGSVGDTVVTLPALKVLREKYNNNSEFWLLTNRPLPGIVSSDSLLSELDLVDHVITYKPLSTIYGIISFIKCIRSNNFDYIFSLLPSERTCIQNLRDYIIFYLSGIKHIFGFRCIKKRFLYPKHQKGLLPYVENEAICRINRLNINYFPKDYLVTPFLFPPKSAIDNARQFLIANQLDFSRKLIAICPGAKQVSNLWPLSNFNTLGEMLLKNIDCDLVLIGGPAEYSAANNLITSWGRGLNACGTFSIVESAGLLGLMDLVIGLDTGTTHLASAQGVPCVALYGGRDHPGRFDPIGSSKIVVLRNRVFCEGCKTSGSNPCPVKHHPCMTGIDVNAVYSKVIDILE